MRLSSIVVTVLALATFALTGCAAEEESSASQTESASTSESAPVMIGFDRIALGLHEAPKGRMPERPVGYADSLVINRGETPSKHGSLAGQAPMEREHGVEIADRDDLRLAPCQSAQCQAPTIVDGVPTAPDMPESPLDADNVTDVAGSPIEHTLAFGLDAGR